VRRHRNARGARFLECDHDFSPGLAGSQSLNRQAGPADDPRPGIDPHRALAEHVLPPVRDHGGTPGLGEIQLDGDLPLDLVLAVQLEFKPGDMFLFEERQYEGGHVDVAAGRPDVVPGALGGDGVQFRRGGEEQPL